MNTDKMDKIIFGYAIRTTKDGKFANPPCSPFWMILPNWCDFPCVVSETEEHALELVDKWVEHKGDPDYECEILRVCYQLKDFDEYYHKGKLGDGVKIEIVRTGLNKD